jgi:hypothetical protein
VIFGAEFAKRFDGRMAFVPEGRCDRSLARSAWDSATQKSRPVGYGLIRAGVCTNSMIGVTNTSGMSGILRPIIPYPTGRFSRGTLPRHFVPGYDQPVRPGQKPFSHRSVSELS